MKKDDFFKDIDPEDLEKEVKNKRKSFYISKLLMGLFLALLLVTMIIPFYAVKLDPEPKQILSVDELGVEFTFSNESHKISSRDDFQNFLKPEDPMIKQISALIGSTACKDVHRICYAKALFYFVRDEINYINDPVTEEYIEFPEDVLFSKAADCDGKSVLLANMLQSIGIETRFVFVPKHVYVQAFLPEALNRYKQKKSDAINLDPACRNCKFGEVSPRVLGQLN